MNKGLVVKITKKYLVVINNRQNYVKLQVKDGLSLGHQIYYTEEDLYQERKPLSRTVVSIASVCAMLLVVVLGWQLLANKPAIGTGDVYAVVTLDINPSIEIQVTKEGLVERIIGLNLDGDHLINFDYKNQSFETVMNQLLENAVTMGYLADEGSVLVASSDLGITGRADLDISDRMEAFLIDQTSNYTFIYCRANEEDVVSAKKAEMSLGRFKLLQLVDETEIDEELLLEMKINDLANEVAVQPALSKASLNGELRLFKSGEIRTGTLESPKESQIDEGPIESTRVEAPEDLLNVEEEVTETEEDPVDQPRETTPEKQNEGTNGKGKKGSKGSGDGLGDGQGR